MNTDATDLSRLHDIVAPPHAPLWPPAPGVAIILGLLAALILTLLYRALVRHQRNRYRREALAELNHTVQPSALSELLKRTALTAYPREKVAALTGASWFNFLNTTANTTVFSTIGPLIDSATYEAATLTPTQTRDLVTATRHWIKSHKVPV